MFSARIVTVDSYQSFPAKGHDVCYSEFRGSEVYKVPIIRVFGITPAGQKTCVHIHGVFPYLSIRCKDVFPNNEFKSHRKYLQELTLDIDKALNVAARNSTSHRHHVYKIISVRRIPFYGYHEEVEDFLRIYFYNPFDVNRTAELLTNGVIMSKFIQPYEAHIPFILQFFIDYNLFGMNLLNISNVKFRSSDESFIAATSPLKSQNSSLLSQDRSYVNNKVWSVNQLQGNQISGQKKQTTCELEADCCESDILNRLEGESCAGKNPGLLSIWEDERLRRRIEHNSSQITPVASQERHEEKETESELFFKSRLKKILEYYQKQYIYNYEVLLNEEKKGLSDYSMKHASSLNLSNAEDEEMLNMMLSMADNQPGHLDEDSILAIRAKNKTDDEIEDDETFEMSQLFVEEFTEDFLSSQNANQIEHQNSIEYNRRISLTDFKDFQGDIKASPMIPQLDGAIDEEYENLGSELPSEKKIVESHSKIDVDDICDSPPVLLPITPLEFDSDEFTKEEISQISPKLDKYSLCDKMQFSVLHSKTEQNIPLVPDDVENISIADEENPANNVCDANIRKNVKVPIVTDDDDLSELISELMSKIISEIEIANNEKQSFATHIDLNAKIHGNKSRKMIKQESLLPTLPLSSVNDQSCCIENKSHIFAKKTRLCQPSNVKLKNPKTNEKSLKIKSKTFKATENLCGPKNTTGSFDGDFNILSLDFSKIGKEVVVVKKLTRAEILASDIDLYSVGTFLKKCRAAKKKAGSFKHSKSTKTQEKRPLKLKDTVLHTDNDKPSYGKLSSNSNSNSSKDVLCLSSKPKEEGRHCPTESLENEQIIPLLSIKVEQETEPYFPNASQPSNLTPENKTVKTTSVLNKSQSKIKTHVKNLKKGQFIKTNDENIAVTTEKDQKFNQPSTPVSTIYKDNPVLENFCQVNNTRKGSEGRLIKERIDVSFNNKSASSSDVKLDSILNSSEPNVRFIPVVKLEKVSSEQIKRYCKHIPGDSPFSSNSFQKEQSSIIDKISSNVGNNFENERTIKELSDSAKKAESILHFQIKKSTKTQPQNGTMDKSSSDVNLQLQAQNDALQHNSYFQGSDCESYDACKSSENLLYHKCNSSFDESSTNLDILSPKAIVPSSKLKVVLTPLPKEYYDPDSYNSKASCCQTKTKQTHKISCDNEQQVIASGKEFRNKLSLKLNKKTLQYHCSNEISHSDSFSHKIDSSFFSNHTKKNIVASKRLTESKQNLNTYIESENNISLRNYRLKSQRKSGNLLENSKNCNFLEQNNDKPLLGSDMKPLRITAVEDNFEKSKSFVTSPSTSRSATTNPLYNSSDEKYNCLPSENIQTAGHQPRKQGKHELITSLPNSNNQIQNIVQSDLNTLSKLKVPDAEDENDFKSSRETMKLISADVSLNSSMKTKIKSRKHQYKKVSKISSKNVENKKKLRICKPNENDLIDSRCNNLNQSKNNNAVTNENNLSNVNPISTDNELQPNSVQSTSGDVSVSVKAKMKDNSPKYHRNNQEEYNVENIQSKPEYKIHITYKNKFNSTSNNLEQSKNIMLSDKNVNALNIECSSLEGINNQPKCMKNTSKYKTKPNKNETCNTACKTSKQNKQRVLNINYCSKDKTNDVQPICAKNNSPDTVLSASMETKTKLHKSELNHIEKKEAVKRNSVTTTNVQKDCKHKNRKLSKTKLNCTLHTDSETNKNSNLLDKDLQARLKVYDLDIEGEKDLQTNCVKNSSSDLPHYANLRTNMSHERHISKKYYSDAFSGIKNNPGHKELNPDIDSMESIAFKRVKKSSQNKKLKSKSKSHRHFKMKTKKSNLEKNLSSDSLQQISKTGLQNNIANVLAKPQKKINVSSEVSNDKTVEVDPSDSKQQLKTGLKMKFKIRRISTRSNETRIVVVEKKLEGFDEYDSDIEEVSNNKSKTDEQNLNVTCKTETPFIDKKHLCLKKSLGNRNTSSKAQLNPKGKYKSPLLVNITNDCDKPFKKRTIPMHHLSKDSANLSVQDECLKIDSFPICEQNKAFLSTIEKDLLLDNKSPEKSKNSSANVNTCTRKKHDVNSDHKSVNTKSVSPDKLVKSSDVLNFEFSDFISNKKSNRKNKSTLQSLPDMARVNAKSVCETSIPQPLLTEDQIKKEPCDVNESDNSWESRFRERKRQKVATRRSSLLCQDFKKYFENSSDSDEDCKIISVKIKSKPKPKTQHCSTENLLKKCKPCEVKLDKISLEDIKNHDTVNSKVIKKNFCPEFKVLSVPSPITDVKSNFDFSIEPSKIFENLFNFPTACNSPFKSKIESPIMIENDRSLDSLECDIYSVKATDSFENEQYRKPENIFAKVEREDMGVLWNLSYLSPIDSNNGYESPPRCYSPIQQKKIGNHYEDFNLSIKAENEKTFNSECDLNYNNSMVFKQEYPTFKVNVENNTPDDTTCKSFKEIECIPNEKKLSAVNNHIPEREKLKDASSNQCITLAEQLSVDEQTPLSFEKDAAEECAKDLNDCLNNSGFESDSEKTLPNVRILDFQECLLESDTEMNPLISEIEASMEKGFENDLLTKVNVNDNYTMNVKMEMDVDEFETLEGKSISLPLIDQLSTQKCSQESEFPKHAEISSGVVYNTAVITAADTSSIPYSTNKDNPVPILTIEKTNKEENICFSEYNTQNFKTTEQTFFPIILTDESAIENGAFFENNQIIIKENSSNMQECINFFESNELLQSCSVSSTSDVEVKGNNPNPVEIPFNGEEDILSMIVKSCDICEEFDDNSAEEPDKNYAVINESYSESNVDQNILPIEINENSSSFTNKAFFHISHENIVSSSSENAYFSDNAVAECSELQYGRKPSSNSQKLDRGENCEEQKDVFGLETEDDFLLDSMIQSFYGEDTLYGLHSSDNFGNVSYFSDLQSSFSETQYNAAESEENSNLNSHDIRVSYSDDINVSFHPPTMPVSPTLTPVDIEFYNETEKSPKLSSSQPFFRNIQLELIAIDSDQRVDTFLSCSREETTKLIENIVVIHPELKPPSHNDVLKWIKASTEKDDTSQPSANEVDEISLSSDGSEDSEAHAYTVCRLNESIQNNQSLVHNFESPASYVISKTPKSNDLHKTLNYPILHKMLSDRNCSLNEVCKWESTPSSSKITSKSNSSNQLLVSPIKNEKILTDGTKQRKRKLFEESLFEQQKRFFSEQVIDEMKALNNPHHNRIQLDMSKESTGDQSGIEGPTLENSRAFKVCFDSGEARVRHEVQYLTIMSLEIHVNTRNDLRPDPKFDAVTAVFYCVYNDIGINEQNRTVGMIVVDPLSSTSLNCDKITKVFKNYLDTVPNSKNHIVFCVESELCLFEKLVSIVHDWDPDILIGYEIQMSSWGYLIERANILNVNLNVQLSRLIHKNESKVLRVEEDYTVVDQTAELNKINITGRIVLCIWRLMRKEITLNVYSFENVYYHVLHRRTPLHTFHDLTNWFLGSEKEKVLRYFVIRVEGSVQLLEKLDIISRTSELARLFGIQFYEVLSRGSQFRVESMMLRSASSLSYIPVSPSVRQRSHARAPECVALILEPESRFYVDPVVVLDFQSLYPSMIIAYNYCFSTCLGRVEHFGKDVPFEFGCAALKTPTSLLKKLENSIHISPTGIAYVKSSIRRGILPQMLEEILNTRVMVKQSMKKVKDNLALKKLLDARQMGLKLIANVTYGYTGANFSGRMPCVEVADSIVGKARETLERAIQFIENSPTWRAKVVYGDTDSLFILLTGRSKEQAFQIGQEMADAVTAMNPKPVKLKFEKVYLPCVLQTKKRYVGYMYETVEQKKPTYDAKGIETVRRDSCPATAKILEKSLKILFETYDVDAVKKYVQKQFSKILDGRASIIDYIFAKEYRGITGYRPGACVPALQIAKKRLSKDPRAEPRVGERVPYVIVYGFPGVPIIQLVREPSELLNDINLRINATYYITRVITPPLERVFNLVGAEVKAWYTNLARTFKPTLPVTATNNHHKGTISQYFATLSCASCGKTTHTSLCDACREDVQGTTAVLNDKIRLWERASTNLGQVCSSCTKYNNSSGCVSIDCPILFKLDVAKKDLSQAPYLRKILAHELF